MDYDLNIIGNEIVNCRLCCPRVLNEPDKGIIPRGMILEKLEKRDGLPLYVVVGINPGKCKENEQEFYLDNGITYSSIKKYFEEIKDTGHFKKTKETLSLLGYKGEILWTDLVKS